MPIEHFFFMPELNLQERLRPKNMDEVMGLNHSTIGTETDKEILTELAQTGRVRSLMLVGPPGTGKTSVARVFASIYLGVSTTELFRCGDYLEKNASEERGIDTIRYDIMEFAKVGSNIEGKCRIVVLDEADGLTAQAQRTLKAVTEMFAHSTIFIYCLNEENKINDALYSRSAVFYFDPIDPKIALEWLTIRSNELFIKVNKEILSKIIDYYKGDLRKIVSNFLIPYQGKTVKKWNPRPTFAEEIYNSNNPKEKYLEIIKSHYIPAPALIRELLILNDYQNGHIFGKAMEIAAWDDLCGVVYALSGVKK